MTKKLCKSRKNKMIAGVCGGLAEYFKIDPTLVRIIAVILAFLKGFGLLAYIIIALIMPQADVEADYESDDDVENLKSANVDSEESSVKKNKTNNAESGKMRSDEDFNNYFNDK